MLKYCFYINYTQHIFITSYIGGEYINTNSASGQAHTHNTCIHACTHMDTHMHIKKINF